MELEFFITDNKILDGDRVAYAKMVNIIYDGRFFKFDYVNKDDNTVHFGTLYGELLSSGKEIKGEFLGYGIVSEMFVSGKVRLRKST